MCINIKMVYVVGVRIYRYMYMYCICIWCFLLCYLTQTHPIPMKKIGFGECRYSYEKIGSGAIVTICFKKTYVFLHPALRVGSLFVLLHKNKIETAIYIYIYISLSPKGQVGSRSEKPKNCYVSLETWNKFGLQHDIVRTCASCAGGGGGAHESLLGSRNHAATPYGKPLKHAGGAKMNEVTRYALICKIIKYLILKNAMMARAWFS